MSFYIPYYILCPVIVSPLLIYVELFLCFFFGMALRITIAFVRIIILLSKKLVSLILGAHSNRLPLR